MPIYEFKCNNCGKVFEELVFSKDDKYIECPRCGGIGERIISLSSFRLKGIGWAKDGYGLKHNKEIMRERDAKSNNKKS